MASIHKSYLISLAAFFGINITFGLIYTTLTYGFEEFNPLSIIGLLVQSIFFLPSYLITNIIGSGGNLGLILLAIGAIVACVIAAVLSGYFGESKGACFGGWGLTVLTAYIMVLILAFIALPIVQSLSGGTSNIFMSIIGTYEEKGPSTLETSLILNLLGLPQLPSTIILYQYMITELGGLESVGNLIVAFDLVLGWTPDQTILNSFLLLEINNKDFITQYLIINNTLGWTIHGTFMAVGTFNVAYSPPTPDLISIIINVSITAGINGIFYGLFALGARRAAFY